MGVAHTVAMLAAIAVMVALSTIKSKIDNPSPPPPEEGGGVDHDQAKHSGSPTTPRGVVDLERKPWEQTYVPPEPPDIVQATRVGWYEDDPENPARTHIHWVNRADWEASENAGRGGDDGKVTPRWLDWLGLSR